MPISRRAWYRGATGTLAAVAVLGTPASAAGCDPRGGIGELWRSLGGERGFLGACTTDEVPVTGGVVQHFVGGSVYWSAATGAREVHGDIRQAYDALGGPSSLLRLPVSSETPTPTRTGAYNHFQGGSVYWSPQTGAHVVLGGIRAAWAAHGWEKGPLGFPTTSERPTAERPGAYSHFEGGSLYWSPPTGAHLVRGAIRERWRSAGAEGGLLGFPTTDETPTPLRPGAYNHFEGGSVYWSPRTGAHAVRGDIREAWAASGWENGVLGLPLTSETPTAGRPGAVSHFEGGSLYWSYGTGAHQLRGEIRRAWLARGAEAGPLGFPTTDETATPVKHGAFNHFENGSMYWSPHTGAHEVRGAIRGAWAGLGWENSWLGFPVSDEYDVPGGRRSDFEGGSIVWDAATGQTRTEAGPRPAFTFTVATVSAADLPHTYREGCPVAPAQLRLLRVSHPGFDGRDHPGELVVHEHHVVAVLRVLDRLHRARFPIERMVRVDAYGGSDDASMDANNTSAFNCRRVAGTTRWSEHAYGAALDLNPVQNPYVSGTTVSPSAGRAYLDRSHVRPGMVTAGDATVRAFADNGWSWGGYWTSSKDYQHFSASGR